MNRFPSSSVHITEGEFPYVVAYKCPTCRGFGEPWWQKCCLPHDTYVQAWLRENMGEPKTTNLDVDARWAFSIQMNGNRLMQMRFRKQKDAALFKVFFS